MGPDGKLVPVVAATTANDIKLVNMNEATSAAEATDSSGQQEENKMSTTARHDAATAGNVAR